MKPTERSTGAHNNIFQFSSDRNIRAAVRREQIRHSNIDGDPRKPKEILAYIAETLEINAIYLDETVPGSEASVESLVSIAGYINSWIE